MLASLSLLTPELIVLFTVFFTTLFGAYAGNSYNKARIISGMLIASFIAAGYYISQEFGNTKHIVFSGFIVNSAVISIAKILILAASSFTLITTMISSKSNQDKLYFEFPVLLGLSTIGMIVFISASNYLVLYLGLELMSLPLYVLAAINRDDGKSSEAGMKYFVLGALTSGLILFGISLEYGANGTLSFAAVSASGFDLFGIFAKVFILIAIFFKISAAPFHMWAPDVYEGSPTQSVCFFATASKVAGIIVLARLLGYWALANNDANWEQIIMFVSAFSMLVGSFGALLQNNIKRLMAYSSISHIGFLLLPIVFYSSIDYQVLFKYLTIYLTMTLGVFFILQNLTYDKSYDNSFDSIAGLSRNQPFLALSMAVFMFSFAGVPPLAGFFAKVYVIMPIIDSGIYWLAILAVLASVISAYYYLRIVKVMYFDPAPKSVMTFKSAPLYQFVLLLLVLFNTLFFLAPDHVFTFLKSISSGGF